jgi:hypothetical protein
MPTVMRFHDRPNKSRTTASSRNLAVVAWLFYEAEETELGLLGAGNVRAVTMHSQPLPRVLSKYPVNANLTNLPNQLIFCLDSQTRVK